MADFLQPLKDARGRAADSPSDEAVSVTDFNRVVGVLNGTAGVGGTVGVNFFPANPPTTLGGKWIVARPPSGGDDGPGIQADLTSAAGGTLMFSNQGYQFNTGVTVPAKTTLWFNGTTITVGATVAAGVFQISTADVKVQGNLVIAGGGFQTPVFVGTTGGDHFEADLHVKFNGMSATASVNNYLYKFTQCNFVTIGGHIWTLDSPWLVRIDRGNHHEVSGVKAGPLTVSSGAFACIAIQDFSAGTTMTDVKVHDCAVDFGGVSAGSYAAVLIAGAVVGFPVQDVEVERVWVKNSTGNTDGMDFIYVQYGAFSDCHIDSCFAGVVLAGAIECVVSNVTASNCRAMGIEIGDPVNTGPNNLITLDSCICYLCGVSDTNNCNIGVFAQASGTNIIVINNCIGYGGGTSKYGLKVAAAGGTFYGVFVTGGYYLGGTGGAAILDAANTGAYWGVKQDGGTAVPGALVQAGGNLMTWASSTASAGLNVPHGAAPTAPVNGDIWSTTAGLFIRINGVTKTVTLT